MRQVLLIALIAWLWGSGGTVAWAEREGTADAVESLLREGEELLVTATRTRAPRWRAPVSVAVVGASRIEEAAYRTTPQILSEISGVMVQETAPGQGSPYIRGFTGFLTLFLIDGIRLNNSVFRPGPNQYWNTVDPFTIDRLEIVKGPSSVLYGSDAVGGTVQAFTKSPYGNGGRLFYRVSSAENSHAGRVEGSFEVTEETGVLAGLSGRHFGDLMAGGEIGRQTGTGYDEWDGDFKLEHLLSDHARIVLAYQQVQQNNVPRTHKTVAAVPFHGTTVGDEVRRDSDQERWLAYVQVHCEQMDGVLDELHASLSWQDQSEVRHRIRSGDRNDLQGFSVGTVGFSVQVGAESAVGRLTGGFEIYHDNVNSFSSANPIQGPVADDATYDLLGLYLENAIGITERGELFAGLRFTWAEADATSVSDPVTGGRIALRDDWSALVASLRYVHELCPGRWVLFGGISQGFRAPNLSDLTMFDSARSGEFEIPAPGLDAEFYTTAEIGLRARPGPHRFEGALFHTWMRDAIDRFPNGETTMAGETVITKANIGDGYLFGIEVSGTFQIHERLALFGEATYLHGKSDTFATSDALLTREYITRLMPFTARLGARYECEEEGRFWIEASALLVDRADRLSPGDLRDTDRIPPGGTPGYAVFHLRAGIDLGKGSRVGLAIENLLDKAYRVHGSGHTMAGRNFVLTFSRTF